MYQHVQRLNVALQDVQIKRLTKYSKTDIAKASQTPITSFFYHSFLQEVDKLNQRGKRQIAKEVDIINETNAKNGYSMHATFENNNNIYHARASKENTSK